MKKDLLPATPNRTRQDDLELALDTVRQPGAASAPARVLRRRAVIAMQLSHSINAGFCSLFDRLIVTPEQVLYAADHYRRTGDLLADACRLPRTLEGLKAIEHATHAYSVAEEALESLCSTAGRGGLPVRPLKLLVLEGDYARADAAFQAAEDPETRVTQFRNRARALGEVEAVAFAAGQAPPLNRR